MITISRDNIESTHGGEVAQLRSQYTEEDKEIIKNFLIAKKSIKHETNVQELNGRMTRDLEDTDQVHLGYYTIIIICVFIVLMT